MDENPKDEYQYTLFCEKCKCGIIDDINDHPCESCEGVFCQCCFMADNEKQEEIESLEKDYGIKEEEAYEEFNDIPCISCRLAIMEEYVTENFSLCEKCDTFKRREKMVTCEKCELEFCKSCFAKQDEEEPQAKKMKTVKKNLCAACKFAKSQ